jgi:hypothetical protein
MVDIKTREHVELAIQQIEIKRRDIDDVWESMRLKRLIADMQAKLERTQRIQR